MREATIIRAMENALLTIASLTAIIVLGAIVARVVTLPTGFADTLSKLVFNITVPCAIFHAFALAEFDLSLLFLAVIGLVCAFVPWLIGVIITRREDYDHRVFMMMNISGFNLGSFTLPFAQTVFPAGSALMLCLVDAGNALMMSGGTFAFSSALLDKGSSSRERLVMAVKRLFSSVPFDLYIVLIALAVLNVNIPSQVVTFIEPIANANSFLSMFMLGLMVQFSIDRNKIGQLVRLIGLRIVFSLVMTVAVMMFLPFDFVTRVVVAALLWSPIGSLGPVYTMWAKGDVGLAGLANVVSIVIAIFAMTITALILA